jgi:probable HAF family extracellular repeat protein
MFGKVERLSVFLAFAIISSSVSAASYSIKDLGLIGNPILNNVEFLVSDINDNGVISGTSVVLADNRFERVATIVDSIGITTLTGIDGSSFAGGVNLSKQVAVTYSSQDFNILGAVWSPITNNSLQTFNNPNAVAAAINNHGNVSGSIEVSGKETAAMWKANQLNILGSLYGVTSRAAAINNQDWVVGHSYKFDGGNASHATLWRDGEMIDLGTLGGRYSYANSINDIGDIVGYSQYSLNDYLANATLWSNGQTIDLGSIANAGSQALDINNHGLVVGSSYLNQNSNDTAAVLWENGVIKDINILISPDSNWYLSSAIAVNNLGQIVGEGYYNGEKRIYMVSMVPEPTNSVMLIAGLGLIGLVQFRKKLNV